MPNFVPTTPYGWVVYVLKDLAKDLHRLQTLSTENISEVEAALSQHYLKQILEALILATRVGRRTWPSLSLQMQSLTTSASPAGTSTDSPSIQTSAA